MDAAFEHQLDRLRGDIAAHVIVEPSPGQDHLRMIANLLGLMGEVVGVNPNAVATNQAGSEGEKVSFGAGRLEHLDGIDA